MLCRQNVILFDKLEGGKSSHHLPIVSRGIYSWHAPRFGRAEIASDHNDTTLSTLRDSGLLFSWKILE